MRVRSQMLARRGLPVLLAVAALLLLASTAFADHPGMGGRPLAATLSGAAETPAGDPDGTGTAMIRVNHGQGEVCWEIHVSNIVLPATAAHIHRAPAGTPGPVVVSLSAPNAQGVATGCRTGVNQDLLKEIIQDPSAFYVNVHNSVYPGGAVRGQLSK